MAAPTEHPRWKTVRDIAPAGIPYKAGVEIRVSGWPKPADHAPDNEAAKRIDDWFMRFGKHPLCPSVPVAIDGAMYLPGILPDYGPPAVFNPHFDERQASSVAPVRAAEEVTGMPRYRCAHDLNLGKATVKADEEFCFLGWPLESFDAVNKSAKSVTAYFAEHRDNPALLPSPWCCWREDIVLPKLPKVLTEDQQAAARKQELEETAKGLRASGYQLVGDVR